MTTDEVIAYFREIELEERAKPAPKPKPQELKAVKIKTIVSETGKVTHLSV